MPATPYKWKELYISYEFNYTCGRQLWMKEKVSPYQNIKLFYSSSLTLSVPSKALAEPSDSSS